MMTKKQILAAMRRFEADPKREFSIANFCEMAGIYTATYYDVRNGKEEMNAHTQKRLEVAFGKLERNEVMIDRRHGCKFVEYRRNPKRLAERGYSLTVRNGQIGIKVGIVNPNCYTNATFEEEIDGHS